MKSTGTIEAGTGLWYHPNTGNTNESGFTGFPGGRRNYDGNFSENGIIGRFWSTLVYNTAKAYNRRLNYSSPGAFNGPNDKENGFPIRCLKYEE